MASRLWTPADLAEKPALWLFAKDAAPHNAAGEIYAGAQPAAHYLPGIATGSTGLDYLAGTSEHVGYLIAPGTEGAFSDASGASIFAIHRLPSGLPADKAAIVCAVTDAEGGDAFALRYGSETPGGGGGGGIIFPDVAIAIQQAWQITLPVDS